MNKGFGALAAQAITHPTNYKLLQIPIFIRVYKQQFTKEFYENNINLTIYDSGLSKGIVFPISKVSRITLARATASSACSCNRCAAKF